MTFFHCVFSGEQRKGDVFPKSLMCISCFQCLHSTMREVTRNNLTWLLSCPLFKNWSPKKCLEKRSRLDISRRFFPTFLLDGYVNPHGVSTGFLWGWKTSWIFPKTEPVRTQNHLWKVSASKVGFWWTCSAFSENSIIVFDKRGPLPVLRVTWVSRLTWREYIAN